MALAASSFLIIIFSLTHLLLFHQIGLSYLQYLGVASACVRNSLKEPSKSRALARQLLSYNKTGKDGVKVNVTSMMPKL